MCTEPSAATRSRTSRQRPDSHVHQENLPRHARLRSLNTVCIAYHNDGYLAAGLVQGRSACEGARIHVCALLAPRERPAGRARLLKVRSLAPKEPMDALHLVLAGLAGRRLWQSRKLCRRALHQPSQELSGDGEGRVTCQANCPACPPGLLRIWVIFTCTAGNE